MRKIFLLTLFITMTSSLQSFSQEKDSLNFSDSLFQNSNQNVKKKAQPPKKKEPSLMDQIQKILGIRRSFDVQSETTKPALLSYKKDDDKEAVFNVDIAFTFKGFRYDKWGFSPSVQFDYSSKPKDQLEKLKGGFNVYYVLYQNENNSGRIEPEIFYAKDFYNKIEQFEISLSYIPRYPDFIIPIRNVSTMKFKYDGYDNRWLFGLNPILGVAHNRTYGGTPNINQTDNYTFIAGDITLKRYYLMLDFYAKYDFQIFQNLPGYYKYDTNFIIFLDDKERSSLNLRLQQEVLETKRSRKITVGFGIKL